MSEETGPPGGAQLELHRDGTPHALIDGVWWPRTDEAEAELTALIEELDSRGTRVASLMLNPAGWRSRPRAVLLAGRPVRITWFSGLEPGMLIASTPSARRVGLQVIQAERPDPQP